MRLLVSGSREEIYGSLAERLRGASVSWDGGRPPEEPFAEAFDAVAFVWPDRNTAAGLALGVRGGKDLLLIDPWRVKAVAVSWMFAMARAAGVRFVVANPERYRPSRRLIHQELAAGKLGRPGLVRIHRWWELRGDDPIRDDGLPQTLLGELDVAIWLMKSRPQTVYACGDVAKLGAYLQVHLGFEGGGMALIDYCSRLPEGSVGYESLCVIGSSGAAYADDREQVQLVFRGGSPQAQATIERSHLLAPIVQEFIDGAPAESGLAMSHTQWQHVRAAADAVRQSLVTKRAVRVEAV